MIGLKHSLVWIPWLFCVTSGLAHAQPKAGDARGALLYDTHCNLCHTSQIHWRDNKLATDWNSLRTQVRRWQDIIGLGWHDSEVSDVTHYLNALHYGFPEPDRKGVPHGKHPNPIPRKD